MNYLRNIFIGVLLSFPGSSFAENCTSKFVFTAPNKTNEIGATDINASYGNYTFLHPEKYRFVMKSSFPHSRYMGVATYDATTQDYNTTDFILDSEIEPDAGSWNPFRPGVALNVSPRNFTIEIGSTRNGATNFLSLPTSDKATITFRLYSLNNGQTFTSESLPALEALDALTGKPVACPALENIGISGDMPVSLVSNPRGEVHFSHAISAWYTNPHQQYLQSIVTGLSTDVVVLRFKAPTFFNSYPGTGVFVGGQDVRYWSFCLTNLPSSMTKVCLSDHAAKIDTAGFVNIAIGPNTIGKSAINKGMNFIDSAQVSDAVILLYRNLVIDPDHAGNFTDIPSGEFAENYIGDYAPIGVKCSVAKFLLTQCK